MATMNISRPDLMRAQVEAQTQSWQYANHSDLIRRYLQNLEELKILQDPITQDFDIGYARGVQYVCDKVKAKRRTTNMIMYLVHTTQAASLT